MKLKIFKIIMSLMVTILVASQGFAQSAPTPAVSKSMYEQLKEKAITYYHIYYNKFFGNEVKPDVAVNPATDARIPASAESTPAPVPTVDQQKLSTLPNYKSQDIDQQLQKTKEIQQSISQEKGFAVQQGQAADPSLKKTKSGVAIFEIDKKHFKKVPLLNIGTENSVSHSDFSFELPKFLALDFAKPQELASPALSKAADVDALVKEKFEVAQKTEKLEDIRLSFPKDITAENINKIQLIIGQETPIALMPYTEISEKQVALLKAIIFSEYQDRCHLAMGFLKKLNDLTGVEKELRDFNYGTCEFKMGFYTEGVPLLLETAARNIPVSSKKALELLLTDLRHEYVEDAASAFLKVKPENIPEKKANEFNYYTALGLSLKGEYKEALPYALKVTTDSKKYAEAQYVASVAEYLSGDTKNSLERQERLLGEIDKRGITGPIKSLTNMNLGRSAYRNKKYKEAINSYKFIGRENSLWIESLTEQGWMQILAGDAAGAIGNMHSIQVPQFKDIYKPDSFVVRAIGYLNICQYGDAKKSLDHLSHIYFPWMQSMKSQLGKDEKNFVFYQNVIDALRSPQNKTELPQPILREISRHKDFLNIQEAINNKVDEEQQFGFIQGLIDKDMNKSKGKLNAARNHAKDYEHKIKTASGANGTIQNVNQWKAQKGFENQTADYYNFEVATIQESLDGFKKFQVDQTHKINEVKETMKSQAGKIMKARLAKMEKKLEKIMENNEFLTYEVFSGSGENIRYVSAGGNVKGTQSTKETALKENPQGKVFLWDFDGEFWADEVGNYKSSLKDNCPNVNSLTQKAE